MSTPRTWKKPVPNPEAFEAEPIEAEPPHQFHTCPSPASIKRKWSASIEMRGIDIPEKLEPIDKAPKIFIENKTKEKQNKWATYIDDPEYDRAWDELNKVIDEYDKLKWNTLDRLKGDAESYLQEKKRLIREIKEKTIIYEDIKKKREEEEKERRKEREEEAKRKQLEWWAETRTLGELIEQCEEEMAVTFNKIEAKYEQDRKKNEEKEFQKWLDEDYNKELEEFEKWYRENYTEEDDAKYTSRQVLKKFWKRNEPNYGKEIGTSDSETDFDSSESEASEDEDGFYI